MEDPTENLVTLATFVVKVYAPTWFYIKTQSSCTQGAPHLWRMINFSRYLKTNLRCIVDEVIQRNAYFSHYENILLAMLTDERNHIRKLAFRRILAAKEENRHSLRRFRVPKLNFEADDYTNLIDWIDAQKSEPPATKNISTQEIKSFVNGVTLTEPVLNIPEFPCHTQSTERHIKLVTEASATVCGFDRRDGMIRAKLESRSKSKTFNTKSQFQV